MVLNWLQHPRYMDQILDRFGCGDGDAGPCFLTWWDPLGITKKTRTWASIPSTYALNIPFGSVTVIMVKKWLPGLLHCYLLQTCLPLIPSDEMLHKYSTPLLLLSQMHFL